MDNLGVAMNGLRPLWNYTALKLQDKAVLRLVSLRPLWNYTALKPLHPLTYQQNRLRPLWNYTALKRSLIDIVVNLV